MNNRYASSPGYRALRRGRISIPGQCYLITTVCEQRRPRFASHCCAVAVACALRESRLWRDTTALCWVLMPDHLHLMLVLGETESLSHAMDRIKSVTAQAANRADGGEGPVWMAGFHERGLRREDDVLTVARAVLANPVRAGLAGSVAGYAYWDCVWGAAVLMD